MKTGADLRIDAVKELSEKVIKLFTHHRGREGIHEAVYWFYTPLRSLWGYSVADLCRFDLKHIAERIVDRIHNDYQNL